MRKLALCALLFLVACEGPTGPQGPAGPQGPPGEVVNHAPVVAAINVTYYNNSYTQVIHFDVDVSAIDNDGDPLVVSARVIADRQDGTNVFRRTLICRESESTAGLFTAELAVTWEKASEVRTFVFEGKASDGLENSVNNPKFTYTWN